MERSTEDMSALIARVALKDRAAFSALYVAASPKLFAVCLRILKDRHEAEEALQEIFVKIWQRADRYAAGGTSPLAWLSTIARNHAIDIIRARKPVANTIDEVYDLADPAPNPEKSAMTRAEGRRIDLCMGELAEGRADAVRKAYVEGLSYQELAEMFGVPLNTMRTWLRRSLLKLRECMER
ncbi:sigma-70 family RNA polymerase sigma factor [Ensifer soli]|uniref:sigma-70 family RNA polymerase sigma factor n=1 Tax=Ciceribacter sp. sgz301302 TaxID=3342379 RepID=UPI0035BACB5A